MGNHFIRNLCSQPEYTGTGLIYVEVCSDINKEIKGSDYIFGLSGVKNISPELILWPSVNNSDIPPAFYGEIPDPLPGHDITGYPVSVEFNDFKFSTPPEVIDFSLKDAQGNDVSVLAKMDSQNDPNGHFSDYQFALFPEIRLDWGSKYTAKIIYKYENTEKIKEWSFATRSLQGKSDKFYRIEGDLNIELNVVSGKSYTVYVVPIDTNDELGALSYTYNNQEPYFHEIDGNTFHVVFNGDIGDHAVFTFNNGQKITLLISNTDNAVAPEKVTFTNTDPYKDSDRDGVPDINDPFPFDMSESVDTDKDGIGNNRDNDDDNDGIPDVVEIKYGLNPLNSSDGEMDLDGDGFSNTLEFTVGTNMYNSNNKPRWITISTGDIVIPTAVK